MNIWLKEISIEDGIEYLNVLNELASYNDAYAKPIPEPIDEEIYEHFKKGRVKAKDKSQIPSDRYPVTTYWVMDGEIPIGYATLKHEIDPLKPGGHFGLCLIKSMQNKGIGTLVSDLLSEIAYQDLGIRDIIYTAKNENIQSQKSLDKIGAKYIGEHDGYHFYSVNLEEKYKKRGR